MNLIRRTCLTAAALCFCATAFAAAPAGKAPAAGPGAKPKELTEAQKKKLEEGKDNLLKFISDRLKHRFTPVIKSVTVKPGAAGKPSSVTVQAGYAGSSIDKITSVKVNYSLDNGQNWENEVALKKAGSAWTGSIPGIKKKGNVLYYVSVKDSIGNVTTDLPCNLTGEALDDGCMVPIGVDPEPVDDPTAKTGDDFDLWEAGAGMDDKYLYLHINVEGQIAKGSMNPLKITSYMALFIDPAALKEMDDANKLMNAQNDPAMKKKMASMADMVRVAIYAPMAPAANNQMKACSLAYATPEKEEKGKDAKGGKGGGGMGMGGKMDDKAISCKKDGADLIMRIDRKVMGKYLGSATSIVLMVGYMDDMQVPIPKIQDVSNFSYVAFKPRTFTVK